MYGHAARAACGRDQCVDIEVGFGARGTAERHGLVSFLHKQRIPIRFREYGHGGDAHLATGAHDTAGDFATICNQDLVHHYMRNTPNCCVPRTSAEWQADNAMPSTVRVSRGSMMPSS